MWQEFNTRCEDFEEWPEHLEDSFKDENLVTITRDFVDLKYKGVVVIEGIDRKNVPLFKKAFEAGMAFNPSPLDKIIKIQELGGMVPRGLVTDEVKREAKERGMEIEEWFETESNWWANVSPARP